MFVSTFEKKSPGSNTSGTTNRVSSSPPPPNRGASTLSGRTKRRCARVGPACKVRGVQGSSIPVFATSGCLHPSLLTPHRTSCSSQFYNRWNSRSSSLIVRIGVSPRTCSPHLGRCASPESWSFLSSSTSFHGPHGPRHLQHVFDVPCSGVNATTKRLLSLRISPIPIVGGLPRLTQLAPSVAPRAPYANTIRHGSSFLWMDRRRSYSRSSDCCVLMYASTADGGASSRRRRPYILPRPRVASTKGAQTGRPRVVICEAVLRRRHLVVRFGASSFVRVLSSAQISEPLPLYVSHG